MNENIIVDSTNSRLSIEYLYCVEMYHTMTFKVKSKKFSGESSFCISNDILLSNMNVLNTMKDDLNGRVQFRDSESDSVVGIEMMQFGKAEVSGQIGGSHQEHYMRFKFESDQTILTGLIDFLKEYIL